MMLSDRDINLARINSQIDIAPYDRALLQPASYDVTLGRSFIFHPTSDELGEERECRKGDVVTLAPWSFVLGTTQEIVRLGPTHAARFEGKSSLGRIGLVTHVTAGFIDPGFEGQITLEFVNVSGEPIELTIGQRIGQLSFYALSSPALRPYGTPSLESHYQYQRGATPAARSQA